MISETPSKKSCATARSDNSIYVVGQNTLQNSLMASFLGRAIGAKCLVINSVLEVSGRKDDGGRGQSLTLWDWHGKDVQVCFFDHDLQGNEIFQHCVIAFFNVPRGLGIEQKVVACGADGVFYEQDSMETLEKGVRAIFAGELWISRTILADYMRKNTRRNFAPKRGKKDESLTPREKEVLFMLASGSKNTDLAEKLFISPHTVRTHLYNLYKKIDVENRVEAILWATKNL